MTTPTGTTSYDTTSGSSGGFNWGGLLGSVFNTAGDWARTREESKTAKEERRRAEAEAERERQKGIGLIQTNVWLWIGFGVAAVGIVALLTYAIRRR